jgi:Ca-activated chloride channel family protein
MNQISWQYPEAFSAIAIFILCYFYCKPKSDAIIFPKIDFFIKSISSYLYIKNFLKYIGVILLITALASPIIQNKTLQNESEGYAISLLLDASGSMQNLTDKFSVSKEIVKDFIKKRTNDQIGLVVFADFAYVASPITYDKNSLENIIDKMKVGVAGIRQTAMYEALFFGSKIIKKSEAKSKIIVLLTDGNDNVRSIPIQEVIKILKKHEIKVYTVGIGNDLDKFILNKIAQETNGKFFTASSKEELSKIYNEIDSLEKSKIKSYEFLHTEHYFKYPLIGSIAAFVLFLLF